MRSHLVSLALCFSVSAWLGCGGPLDENAPEGAAEGTSTADQALSCRYPTMLGASFVGTAQGNTLRSGQCLRSCNLVYSFCMQWDGNLVLYKLTRPLWATRTNGTGATSAVMQDDGNFVVYAPGRAVWASNTVAMFGTGASSYVVVQNDGNVVMYDIITGRPIWATGTNGR